MAKSHSLEEEVEWTKGYVAAVVAMAQKNEDGSSHLGDKEVNAILKAVMDLNTERKNLIVRSPLLARLGYPELDEYDMFPEDG